MELPFDPLNVSTSELEVYSKVKLKILKDQVSLFQDFARTIADEIRTNNEANKATRLILPVGPVGQYPLLVQICNRERISWHNTHTFNMDEYCDWQGRWIPEDHPLSFRGIMQRVLFDRLDPELRIPSEQAHFPDPLNLDRISQDIKAVGGIDTCYGGIGYHGHIAFNEPPISRWFRISINEYKNSKTRVVSLADDSIVMNSIRNTGGNPEKLPPMAVTLGMADILASLRIRIYCPGGMWQRHTVRMALLGEPQVEYPATLLQGHSDYMICLDTETAQPAIYTS